MKKGYSRHDENNSDDSKPPIGEDIGEGKNEINRIIL